MVPRSQEHGDLRSGTLENISDVLSAPPPRAREADPLFTSAGISHTPAEKEMWPGSISVILAQVGRGLQQCALHTG